MGADAAFDELYARHAPPALRLAVLLCAGDRAQAEDLVAEAFARVLPRWRAGAVVDFGPYLRAAVVNELRGGLRRASRHERSLALVDPPVPPDLGGAVTDRAALVGALASLPVRQRAAIVLRYFADLPERDVASLLDCPVGTVKAMVSRGLVKLRSLLEEGAHA